VLADLGDAASAAASAADAASALPMPPPPLIVRLNGLVHTCDRFAFGIRSPWPCRPFVAAHVACRMVHDAWSVSASCLSSFGILRFAVSLGSLHTCILRWRGTMGISCIRSEASAAHAGDRCALCVARCF
jgi:hypothetical protein